MFKVGEICRGSRLLKSTHPGSCLDGAKKVTGNWCHPVLKVWCNVLHLHCLCNEWAPSCAKSHFAGHVVIQLCYSIRRPKALLEKSNPSPFERTKQNYGAQSCTFHWINGYKPPSPQWIWQNSGSQKSASMVFTSSMVMYSAMKTSK